MHGDSLSEHMNTNKAFLLSSKPALLIGLFTHPNLVVEAVSQSPCGSVGMSTINPKMGVIFLPVLRCKIATSGAVWVFGAVSAR